MTKGSGVGRRGVLILLGCAWTVALAAAGPDRPVAWAQVRAPIVGQTPAAPSQRPRLISLDFKDADINNVLRILAEFSGLNIVASEDVKGKVTVKLQNVPWQQALDSVVRAAKLAYVQEGNIIRVDRLANLSAEAEADFRTAQREVELEQRREDAKAQRDDRERARKESEEKADFERRQRLEKADFERRQREREEVAAAQQAVVAAREAEFLARPLVEEIIPLKYAHVGVKRVQQIDFFTDAVTTTEERGIEETIRGAAAPGATGAGLLSPRGQLTVDQRTNSLILRDIPENVAKIKEFIAKMDRAALPVVIEARVVEMSKEDARALGVVWGGAFTPRTGQNSPVIGLRGAAPNPDPDAKPDSVAARFAAPTLTTLATAPFGLALGWLASNLALDIQLQALEGERRARVLSTPSLTTLDNQPGTIASGTKFPIISITVVGGAQQPSITFQDVTTRLQVTPRIIPDTGRLVLSIAVKRETLAGTVQSAGLTAPIVNTRNTVTQAEIPDGGTVVLSGLKEDSVQNDQRGVPWLRKIPLFGWLFKNALDEARRDELVIFLTAKVVQVPGQASVPGAPATGSLPPGPPGPTGQAPAPLRPGPVVSSLPAVTPVAERPARPTYPVSAVGDR